MDALTTPALITPAPVLALPKEYTLAATKVLRRDARARRLNGEGATTAGMAITTKFISKLVPVVITKLTSVSAKATEDAGLEFVIRNLAPEVLALAIMQGALHSIGKQDTLRDTYKLIGRMVEEECFAAKLIKHDAKRAEQLMEQVTKKHGSVAGRRSALRRAAAKPSVVRRKSKTKAEYREGFSMQRWGVPQLLQAGAWGVSRLKEALPEVFTIVPAMREDGAEMLVLTEAGMSVGDTAMTEAILTRPVYGPRTTAPEPWTRFLAKPSEDGRVRNEVPLLRTFHKDVKAAAAHAIRTGQAAPALKGVNVLQAVPFQINTWVLDLIDECWSQGIPVPGLPMQSALQLDHMSTEAFVALSVEERDLHSRKLATAKKLNLARIGETMSFHEDMATARELAKAGTFYTPMNMDWRGRVYGISFFNFQREDRVRSLFLFSNGKPITERGIYWLKVHVANCGAFDKIDKRLIAERVAWVDEHLDVIREAVEWPTGRAHQWWRDADAPFLFLAASRELVRAIDAGPAYVCHMPVSFDGSCSGIQHLACMTRAEEGRFVNLTDNELPEDIYQRVADIAKATITADLERNVEELIGEEFERAEKARRYAKLALDYGVDRKLCKRNTMTFAYSSKVFGMSQQQLVDTMEPLKVQVLKGEREEHPFGDDSTQYAASKYLARHIYAAITTLVKRPAEAMQFLQHLAGALAHEGKPLRWVTPVGLPWINRYHEPIVEKIRLTLTDNGVRVHQGIIATVGNKAEISKDRARNAVAPNFVHALDSSHLLLTVGAAADEGITDIATVHDSFGCLPSEADRFNEIIRAELVRMYEDHDVLAEIFASARADLTEANHDKLPAALPEKGTLNLEEIKDAKYAFA